jgi:dethiobiotin synthetase
MKSYFITGTDTEIGKTFATCALIVALRARGLRVAPMKPVAAGSIVKNGVNLNEDVHALCTVYGAPIDTTLVNPYCYTAPIAPHIAAAREGITPSITAIEDTFAKLASTHDTVLVEGAGGFLVPFTNTISLSALPVRLQTPVILVVGLRLGCLNHALLTAEAIRARGIILAGWIGNVIDPAMSALNENIATLKQQLLAPCLGVIPRIVADDVTTAARQSATYLQIDALLG